MAQPLRKPEHEHLQPIELEAKNGHVAITEDSEDALCFGGGNTPPPAGSDNFLLWCFLCIGCVLICFGLFALAHDSAVNDYAKGTFSLGSLRVSFEQLITIVGCGCAFTSFAVLRARHAARKIETETKGRVKSLKAKRLEKLSEMSVLEMIVGYVSRFPNH